jgi:DNA-binding response OmpR family regulator
MTIKSLDESGGKRLLVVEDDPFLSDIYNTKLRQAGFSVDLAMTGEDCLRKLNDNEYDLMVLDIVLPQVDGWEILSRLRPCVNKKLILSSII